MRHNAEIYWKDKAAIAAMQGMMATQRYEPEEYPALAKQAYRIAEAMYLERNADEHNPPIANDLRD